MALSINSDAISEVSGKTGGTVFSRNKGGGYFKGLVIPTNTKTQKRHDTRKNFADITRQWQQLTAEQRTAWEAYAREQTHTNRIGQATTLSGKAWYTRLTTNLVTCGETPQPLPPTTPPPEAVKISMMSVWMEGRIQMHFSPFHENINSVLLIKAACTSKATKQIQEKKLIQVHIEHAPPFPKTVNFYDETIEKLGAMYIGLIYQFSVTVIDKRNGLASIKDFHTEPAIWGL